MRQETTTYFEAEGRASMEECINLSVEWCARTGLRKVVIFTGTGEGPYYAAKEVLPREEYSDLEVIAVTPAVGRAYRAEPGNPDSPVVYAGIRPAMRDELTALGIEVVSAHLPFSGIQIGRQRESEWTRVAEAYGVLGGGFSLCVQALLLACDAGSVESGERVVVATADTAFVAVASRTESFLSQSEGLLIEHIICRPMRYSISKRLHLMKDHMWAPSIVEESQMDSDEKSAKDATGETSGEPPGGAGG
jgi:hypothetical protein